LVQEVDGRSTLLARLPMADPHSFAWSPNGKLIAFVTGNSIFTLAPSNLGNVGPSAIWILRADGGEPRKLTGDVALNTSPVWMADSRHLLFVSNRDGPRDVYRVLLDRNGAGSGPVERVTQGLNPSSISLAANGHRLAYSTLAISANIWMADVPPDGRPANPATLRALTVGSDLVEAVSLSHDGRWLYFDSNLHGTQDVYRMPAGGGPIVQLTTNPGDDFNGELSPDDREMAFHAVRNGTRDILLMPAGGGPETTIYSGPYEERWPHWSPDGQSIAFSITEAPPDRAGLYVTRRTADGSWSAPRRVNRREVQGYWTPDGKALLLERGFADWENERLEHYIQRVWVDTGRTDSIPLPFENASFVGTRVAPGGRELILRVATQGGSVAYWAMPINGGKARLVLRPRETDIGGRAYWATNGKRIYFVRTERESDVFVAEVNR
ncbi:MAG TPA: hypothetical protein VGC48_05140, partial [Gemmatimonadales bacterium]